MHCFVLTSSTDRRAFSPCDVTLIRLFLSFFFYADFSKKLPTFSSFSDEVLHKSLNYEFMAVVLL